ncbi:DPP IV N-terminal domain-containing protein [Sphingomonas sp. RP10(2022)]|uniref:DPP IV N-terminal domain-containing protein n=1 Tax=Sphingomonas liriopis TaxID=2949094 RepID=A0A9X2I0Z2_9SPHN|nr:S9 family peptidase [Sphingomonas liriopis]MCP3736490.1 DPP IV N-terminal domain-containing protein [Sphingomonas liriopis]
MRAAIFLAGVATLMMPAAAVAQTAPLTLDRIFGKDAIPTDSVDGGEWTADGSGYVAIERSADVKDGSDLVRYDVARNTRSVQVAAHDLIVKDTGKPLRIEGYAWSNDGKRLLIFTNGQRFRRTRALGDYWLFDTTTKALRKVGGDAPAASLMYAEFAPDGQSIAYVRGNNLYVEATAGGAARKLTSDGNDLIVNGLGDWVYEEEFYLKKAWSWSPDSKRIAFWRFDTSGVGTFYMITNTVGQYSKPIPLQYPKVGTTNSAVRVGSVDVASGATQWIRLDGDPRQNYVPQMSWAGSSGQLFLQYANRLQNTYQVLLADPASGTTRPLFVERDAAWVEANENPTWLDGGRRFTWMSERDGWRHLYLASADGKRLDLRTPGKFDVVSLLQVDAKSGWAWFIASPDNPTQRYLYRATLTGKPRVERVTPGTQAGTHSYDIAPGAHWARHTVSGIDRAPVTDMVDLTTQTPVRVLARNAALQEVLSKEPLPPTEFVRLDLGKGVSVDARLLKPANFDPAKRYPVLFYVYGEPWGQTVADAWEGRTALWHRMLAERGYIVASIDPRGTNTPRGRDWRKIIYRQLGVIGPEDYAAGVRKLLGQRPYMDPARIGIWGWSGGGSSTLHAMFRFPDLFKTGIAVAAVSDQTLYDTIYQERYMGLPSDNAAGFKAGSPITYADGLKGNLLMIHGTGDDNVHYQNLEVLEDKLIAANKPFTMMAYPDRTHGIYEKPGTSLHLFSLMTRYLDTNLPAGAR